MAFINALGWLKMQLERYDKTLHASMVQPWYDVKGDGATVDWLPSGSTYLVRTESGYVASGALLLTNSSLCFMEHLATDPSARQVTQAKALRFIALSLEQIAKSLNYTVILGLVPEDHFSLAEFYKRQGARLGTKLMRVAYKAL